MSTAQEALLDAGPAAGEAFEGEAQVEAIRWCSEDGRFAVVDLSLEDGTPLCAVGPLGHLEEGSRARLTGVFELHERHGLQLSAREAEPLDPAGLDGARRYLESLPWIGRSRASELVATHGDDVFTAIDRDPAGAFGALRGLSDARAAEAAEEWADRRAERRLYALLAPHGMARHIGEVMAIHGTHAAEEVRADPYSLTAVEGVGFLSADRLAIACGIDPRSPERLRAAAIHALREAEGRGHTHLPAQRLVEALRSLLGGEPAVGTLATAPGLAFDGTLVYREWTLAAERWVAATMAGLARSNAAWERPPRESEFADLNEPQRQATINALTRRLSVITGGPGTGKTHLTDALARMADARDLRIRLLAPTGRAARRLTVATNGAPASTIHKALEWIPGEIPGRDESAPIEADLVIVDEASMLSLEICRHLLAAIGPETHLVLIGDADQLPPVGPGKPFCELIEAGVAPTVRLDHVFRQARRSMIVGAAHSIRRGERPRSEPSEDEIRDFFLHRRARAEELADGIVRIATERIPEQFDLDPVRQVQILAPQYRGPLGIDELHRRMRDALCGGAPRCLDGRFTIGEKVITTRSLPEQGIANGTLFVIDTDDEANGELLLESDLGELIAVPHREARTLRGAFCTSVHKAQGFEIPAVIVCLHGSHAPQLLSRNLLYTAVTRARELCVLAGDDRAIGRALRNTEATDRYSRLIDRMAGRSA